MKELIACVLVLLLSGCGGSYVVTRTAAPAPKQIQAVAVTPMDGNSAEVDGYLNSALIGQGLMVKAPLAAGTRTSLDVDAIVSYQDIWRWDMSTYLAAINIYVYEASSGNLLVTGKWEYSFFHTYYRGESISQELLKQMLAKMRGQK